MSHDVIAQRGIGYPFIENYIPEEDYNGSTQNWWVLPSKNGNLYFANNNGILQYDGTRWTMVDYGPSGVRSLAETEDGRIYTGGSGKCGYLEIDPIGEYEYHSLDHLVPSHLGEIGEIHNITIHKSRIYFQSDYYALVYDGDSLVVIPPPDDQSNFFRPHLLDNRLYVQVFGRHLYGLFEIVDDSLVYVPKTDTFRNSPIVGFVSAKGRTLAITRGLGVFETDQKLSFFERAEEFDDFVYSTRHSIQYFVRAINDSLIGVGTLRDGLHVLNTKGDLVMRFDKESGLVDNSVFYFSDDRFGNLWLGTDRGISQVFLNSRIKLLAPQHGLEGKANTSFLYKDQFYVGGTTGILKHDQASNRLKKIGDIRSYIWDFVDYKNRVYFSGKGLHYVSGDTIVRTANCPPFQTWFIRTKPAYPDRIFIGTRDGILVFKEGDNGILEFSNVVKGWSRSCRWIEPGGANHFWVTDRYNGLYRLEHDSEVDSITAIVEYGEDKGLPGIRNYVLETIQWPDSPAVVCVLTPEHGVFRYQPEKDIFVPYTFFSFSNGEGFSYLEQTKDGAVIFQLDNMTKGIVWPNGQVDTSLFARLKKERMQIMKPVGDGMSLNGYNAAYLYTPPILGDSNRSVSRYKAVISSVAFKGSLVAGPFWKSSDTDLPQLEHRDNSIKFEYGAQFFEKQERTLFSYQLEGYDKDWSAWTLATEKEYNSLFEGVYRFRVKAKNIFHEESLPSVYVFEITRPWYRSIAAYVSYILLALMVIFGVARWFSWNLRRKNLQLEATIEERTSEIRYQKEEIEAQAIELKDANKKLQELDRFKQSMNGMIVHDLKNPLSAILSVSGENRKVKNYAQRMLGLVNNLLDTQKYKETKLALQLEWVSIKRLIVDSIEVLEADITEKSMQVVDLTSHQIEVKVDRVLIQRVLVNILANAIKYSPTGGVISIASEQNGREGELQISISDTGKGIPEDELETVFDEYKQVGGQRRDMSTGIGLTFCKMVVEAHGSKIGVSSVVGEGATFFFGLPFRTVSTEMVEDDHDEKESSSVFNLSVEERTLLQETLKLLLPMKVFRAGAIEEVLAPIETIEHAGVQTWKEQVLAAAYQGNQTAFEHLLKAFENRL